MKYHRQLNKHDPENGVYGDCYRTVIACLLDLKPTEVPHVCDGLPDDYVGSKPVDDINEFLANHAVRHFEIPVPFESLDQALNWGAAYFGDSRYTLCGKSSGGERNHIVICKGAAIEHSTNDSTLVAPCINDGYWWIGCLVKLL